MFELRKGTQILIILYILIALSIFYYKPPIMFDKNEIKEFGVGNNKTIFYFPCILIFLSLFMFFFFEVLWLKKNNLL